MVEEVDLEAVAKEAEAKEQAAMVVVGWVEATLAGAERGQVGRVVAMPVEGTVEGVKVWGAGAEVAVKEEAYEGVEVKAVDAMVVVKVASSEVAAVTKAEKMAGELVARQPVSRAMAEAQEGGKPLAAVEKVRRCVSHNRRSRFRPCMKRTARRRRHRRSWRPKRTGMCCHTPQRAVTRAEAERGARVGREGSEEQMVAVDCTQLSAKAAAVAGATVEVDAARVALRAVVVNVEEGTGAATMVAWVETAD